MPNRHGSAVRLRDNSDQYEVISDDQSWLLLRLTGGSTTRWARATELAAMSRPFPSTDVDENRYLSDLEALPERASGSPIRVGDHVAYDGRLRPGTAREGVVESFVTLDGVVRVRLVGSTFPLDLSGIRLVRRGGHVASSGLTPRRCTVLGYATAPERRHGCRAPQRQRVTR
ncbi:hypothetical protein [Tessaracoccus palaemonis]|uniref:Uncharacterized protein n=1 Tax=Tessaracoccus palaemonis TaxID=2829499 RepID=A0ABX8SHJ9_9ACTN|nr:hypothetical protein [Tessaracoccus palaemonis]QXT61920.1 hypothetical protein KDB89_08970 [Tessaracoccus palaemonis]